MTKTTDQTPTESEACDGQLLGEELTYQGPGWAIAAPLFDVICWAPGEIMNDGVATGARRLKWMLWVEVGERPPRSAEGDCDRRPSSSFVTGASLGEVVQALGLLPDSDRGSVIDTLFQNLVEGQQ